MTCAQEFLGGRFALPRDAAMTNFEGRRGHDEVFDLYFSRIPFYSRLFA